MAASNWKAHARKYRNHFFSLFGGGTQKVRPLPGRVENSAKAKTFSQTEAIEWGLRWLMLTQDVTADHGSSAYFNVRTQSWARSYPETTGYIVVTFLEAFETISGMAILDELPFRCRQMIDWLLPLQLASGGFPGDNVGSRVKKENLFNTGQILNGLLAYSAFIQKTAGAAAEDRLTSDRALKAAERAADWMASTQSKDGTWTEPHIYDLNCRTYYSRAVWPLATAATVRSFPRAEAYRRAATAFGRWVCDQQNGSGWIEKASFLKSNKEKEFNTLHTIAYTIEGLLEMGVTLGESRFVEAAKRAAEGLLRRLEIDGKLAGEFGENWKPAANYTCLTGVGQMGRVWGRLYELTGDLRFFNGLLKVNDSLRFVQTPVNKRTETHGGFPGSLPIYERYQPNQWPNWATKFILDSYLIENRVHQKTTRFPHPLP